MSRAPTGKTPDIMPLSPTKPSKGRITHILSKDHQHYTIAACVGPSLNATRSMRPTLDTKAGINLIRTDMLPNDWHRFSEPLDRSPRIVDANGQRMKIPYAIYLYVNTGGVQAFARFLVSSNLAVPGILGTKFIN